MKILVSNEFSRTFHHVQKLFKTPKISPDYYWLFVVCLSEINEILHSQPEVVGTLEEPGDLEGSTKSSSSSRSGSSLSLVKKFLETV